MKIALVSIHPGHHANIANGLKRFEVRRSRINADAFVLVCTGQKPPLKVTHAIEVVEHNHRCDDWMRINYLAGIALTRPDQMRKYCDGIKSCFAYEITNLIKLERPMFLAEFGTFNAPQFYKKLPARYEFIFRS